MREAAALAWLALAAAGVARAQAGVDAGAPEPPAVDAPGTAPIEDFQPGPPIEAFQPSSPDAGTPGRGPRLNRTWAELSALAGVDGVREPAPRFGTPEHVVEGRVRAVAGADVQLADGARMVLEARARWRGVAQAGWQRPKAELEARLGDAFVDLYSPRADLRVGWQRIPLGANALLAPADALNPRDLREGLWPAGNDPEAALLTVPAVRAQGELGPARWLLAYVPFFEPHRYAVFGQDEALLQPAAEVALPVALHPSVEDRLQDNLLETSRPAGFGLSGDVAARVRVDVGRGHAGAGWLWGHEKLPQVEVDPELALALKAQSLGQAVDPAVLLSLQNRLAAGEPLYQGTYPRQHTFWLEGSALVGPVQLDADVAYSPSRAFSTDTLASLRRPGVTWVLGASPSEDSALVYSASYLGMAVPSVPAEDLLFLYEPATARGAARTAWFHLLVLAASRKFLDDRLEVSAALAFEPVQRSFFLSPQASYEAWPDVRVGAALALYGGPPASPFGYFDRNDQVLFSAVWQPR